jgi:sarcosine oxidase
MTYDAIVVGIGGMGSAACWHMARRGLRVLGLERFDIPHAMGSSHGLTRIIRLPYYEDPAYVPLLRRAYELWRELERATGVGGERLLTITGSVDCGPPGNEVFEGALRSARAYGLPHEVLTSAELTRRFPAYRLPAETMTVWQPDGGFLASERCIVVHVQAAQAAGAEIRARERVLGWEPTPGGGIRVTTDRGATYEAGRLVLSAGAWIGDLVPALRTVGVPERQVLAWLQPSRPELFMPDSFPVFNMAVEEGRYYGLPIYAAPGFKLGRYHHLGETGPAETADRDVHPRDEAVLRRFAERYFPEGAGPTMALRACLFTNTPDEHFVIDAHPELPQVILASPCSGHGFKFCSVVGEILADLAGRGETRHDIEFLRLDRFADSPPKSLSQ